MDLKHLTDDELHLSSVKTSDEERAVTLNMLKHLNEVDRRHLFSKYKANSLFAYCVKYLKMSEAHAGRRIAASKLLRELPTIEEKVQSGSLTLTAVCQASYFFKAEAKSGNAFNRAEKLELLQELDHQSKPQTQQILIAHSSSPEIHFKEKITPKTAKITEIKLMADEELMARLNRLREIHSHSMPGATFAELIKRAVKTEIEKADPLKKSERAAARREKGKTSSLGNRSAANADGSIANSAAERRLDFVYREPAPIDVSRIQQDGESQNILPLLSDSEVESQREAPAPAEFKRPRYIPSAVRHTVWMRDKGRCTFVDEQTGECCESRSFVQCDHIIAFANGGEHTVDNLRLRCQAHNHRHAVETYGLSAASAWRTRSQSRVECLSLVYG